MTAGGSASGGAPLAGPQRVHHSYIWLGGLRIVVSVLVVIAVLSVGGITGIIAAISKMPAWAVFVVALALLGAVLLVVALAFGYQWWSWRHLSYEVGPDEFTLCSGIFNKKRVHVPYQRVQSVDVNASLFQRLFGVCVVSIDTAGGASNKAVYVSYLQRSVAEWLRAELFARKRQALDDEGASAVDAAGPSAVRASAPSSPQAFAADGSPTAIFDVPVELWDDIPTPFAGADYADAAASYEYGLSNNELALTGLSNAGAFSVAVIAILALVTQAVTGIAPFLFGFEEPGFSQAVVASSRLFGGSIVALVIFGIVIAAVVAWGLSIVGTCISYGGFRARRRARRIEVERGLLQHRASSVDIDRIQSVIIKQSFIRRIIGYCELSLGKIDTISTDDAGMQQTQQQMPANGGIVVHPFVKIDRVPEILRGLAPEFADIPIELAPLPRVALRRAIIRRVLIQGGGLWLAVVVSAVAAFLLFSFSDPARAAAWFNLAPDDAALALRYTPAGAAVGYALSIVLFVLDAIGAVLWYRHSGFAYNDRFMRVLNGGFSCDSVSFPRRKIQFGFMRTNPLQRLADTATICVRTAAGVGGTTTRLVDVDAVEAERWLAWLELRLQVESS